MFEGQYLYNIGFIGAFDSSRMNVKAGSIKEAKRIFARYHGIDTTVNIVAKKHNVTSLNEDCKKWMTSYYADRPEEYKKKI